MDSWGLGYNPGDWFSCSIDRNTDNPVTRNEGQSALHKCFGHFMFIIARILNHPALLYFFVPNKIME